MEKGWGVRAPGPLPNMKKRPVKQFMENFLHGVLAKISEWIFPGWRPLDPDRTGLRINLPQGLTLPFLFLLCFQFVTANTNILFSLVCEIYSGADPELGRGLHCTPTPSGVTSEFFAKKLCQNDIVLCNIYLP